MLKRIKEGKYPSYPGPPAAVRRAMEVDATADLVQRGGLAPHQPAEPSASMAERREAVVAPEPADAFSEVLADQAREAVVRPPGRAARERAAGVSQPPDAVLRLVESVSGGSGSQEARRRLRGKQNASAAAGTRPGCESEGGRVTTAPGPPRQPARLRGSD